MTVTTPRAHVRTDVGAGPLERLAASELARYAADVFGLNAEHGVEADGSASLTFLVGAAERPIVREATSLPVLSDQGILLRTVEESSGTRTVLVCGGSERATLWAVYELAERWGVRFLLHEDVLPEGRAADLDEIAPPDLDVAQEPALKIRTWRAVNSLAFGPISWGVADYRRILGQLAKLKFNRVLINIWSFQPFLDPVCRGVRRTSAHPWFGYSYPITEDMIGREAFEDRSEFWNPDLPIDAPYEELAEAGRRHIKGVMQCAHDLGMEVALGLNPLEFPPEFAPLLKDHQTVEQLGAAAVVPGPGTSPGDADVQELASCMLRTAKETYPETDLFALTMPEWRQWTSHFDAAWQDLDARHGLADVLSAEEALDAARGRATETNYMGAGSDRAVNEVKGDLVTLAFYDRLLAEPALRRDMGEDARFIFCNVAEELYPALDRILPERSELLSFVDYTPARIVGRKQVLSRVPAESVPCSLILTLHDDNIGALPQSEGKQFAQLIPELIRAGWAGFSTRYWLVSDHDPALAYIARASWKPDIGRREVYRDQVLHVCGHGAPKHLVPAFDLLEQATELLEMDELGICFPVPGMVMKHWRTDTVTETLRNVRRLYREAQEAVAGAYHSADRGTPARRYTAYWMNRLEFGYVYIDAIDAMRAAARAEESGDRLATVRQAKMALGTLTRAIELAARSVRNRSDLGSLAVLNEYGYRALSAKVASLPRPEAPSSR